MARWTKGPRWEYEIAEAQDGYFTTSQAAESPRTRGDMVDTTNPKTLGPLGTLGPGGSSPRNDLPRHVLDNFLKGCQVISPDFKYVYVNDAATAHGAKDRLLGRTMMEAYPGIESTEMFAVLRRCMETRSPKQMENEFTFPDGSKGWFELRFEPTEEGVMILSIDITERKSAEAALQRSNRALAALSRYNQTLMRAKDERQFMDDVCRLVVDTGGYRLAWIGMKDGDGMRSARPVARAGVDDGYVDHTWDETERGAGPGGRAIRTGQPVVARFIATDPELEPWREDALARGIASYLALPIRDNGEILGALAIYAAEPDAFDEAECALLAKIALDLGDGVTTLRSRDARREAETRVVHLTAVLRGIRNVNQLITRERDPQALIQKTCELLVESHGFPNSCILVCNGDKVRMSADAGVDLKLHAPRQIISNGELPECVQRALEQSAVVMLQEPPSTCAGCLVATTCDAGRDAAAVRLESEGRVFGALLVSLPPEMTAVSEELDLLREVADNVAIALCRIDLEQQREQAEDLLQDKVDEQNLLFGLDLALLCIADTQGRFIKLSIGWERTLGFTLQELEGQSFLDLVHPDDLESTHAAIADLSAQKEVASFVNRYRCKDGAYRWIEWRSTPNGDQIIALAVDITERRRAETERKELEEQLMVAQRLEAVGLLAGGVAHDFNNLLSVIINYAGFVTQALRESDPVHADVVEIQNAGRRAAALTRQLLAFSRKQILEPEVLNLNKVVSGIESMLRLLIAEDIDIEVHLDEPLGSVMADPGQLEQVIVNLVVNARDAMPQGGKLTIETTDVELDKGYSVQHVAVKPGHYVLLSVADTGTGMDAETKAQIFDPFFTTKEKGKGTGLGLSTVYGIVKQSSGNIWVYSEPGHGTTVKVYLPRVDMPAVDVRRKPASVTATGSETVLIVEDEVAVCKIAERILRNAGYKVLSATSGGDALLLCEGHRGGVDLLLTDVVMPQMSGRELAERLAKLWPDLRVLYMSGYTDDAIVHHGVLELGTRFIGKPFAAAELARKVRDVLDEGKP